MLLYKRIKTLSLQFVLLYLSLLIMLKRILDHPNLDITFFIKTNYRAFLIFCNPLQLSYIEVALDFVHPIQIFEMNNVLLFSLIYINYLLYKNLSEIYFL